MKNNLLLIANIQWKDFCKLLAILTMMAGTYVGAQTCSSCGHLGSSVAGGDTGPNFQISLGYAQYVQSAGDLMFETTTSDPCIFTPAALQYDSPTRTDVFVITTNEVFTPTTTNYEVDDVLETMTNVLYITNSGSIFTNWVYTPSVIIETNPVVPSCVTNAVIRQVQAPQIIADVPVPPTANGYAINFYFPTNVSGTNLDGTFQFSGSPYISWIITNSNPSGPFQLQVSEIGINPSNGLVKQWTYTYYTNTGTWLAQTLGGIQEYMTTTNLDGSNYQVIDTFQNSSGPVVRQIISTYETMNWSACTNVAIVTNAVGSGSSIKYTTYTYWDPATFSAPSLNLIKTASYPDGSWKYYNSYDVNGNPTVVYFSFEDVPLSDATSGEAGEMDYTYDPSTVGVSGTGDDGSQDPDIPRLVVKKIQGNEVSRQYTVFPATGVRWDIQCTTPGASWNNSANLITTNYFYTSGPDQFEMESMFNPDGTATFYNYITNGFYQTNITVTGQPDTTGSFVVNGTSNLLVFNEFGNNVLNRNYDILTADLLSQDVYSNFDVYSRPQQVTHLDSTTEYMYYACCGLDNTIDRDGVNTVYLYDTDERQIGYESFYSSSGNPIAYENNLDAVGENLQRERIGTNDSVIILSQSAYDTSGELVAQTNALGGDTVYTWANDPTTGGYVRTTIDPDGGTVTNFFYADGSLKETAGTGVHGKAYGHGYATDVNGNACTYTTVTNLNADGSLSSEWTETFSDMAGRTTEILYADGHYSQSFYNSQGQFAKQIDPDGITTLYQYNAKDELAYTAIDMNQNGAIDFSGMDRITLTTNDVTSDHGTVVQRSRTYGWAQNGVNSSFLLAMSETSANGLDSWQTQYRDANTPVTSTNVTSYGSGSRTVVANAPDGSYTINDYSYSRLVSSTHYDSQGNQIGGMTYSYDPQGRQYQMTDARNGTTTLGFNNADLVTTNTTPNPGGGSPETTTTTYNNMLQASGVTQPDNTVVNSSYRLTGELALQYGSRTYPVAYSYDYAGRMKTMTNWSNFTGYSGARVTTWNYDGYRGFMTNKVYDGGANGPFYTYTGAGRLASRTWARGTATTYSYDNGGSLTNILYSDTTGSITNTYDRLGRLSTASQNEMADTLTYNLANQLISESFSGGPLNGLSVTNGYDSDLRRTSLTALSSSSPLFSTTYGYDYASRLSSVSDGNSDSATYSYIANSPLVGQITYKQGSTMRMTTSKSYDYLNRLTQVSSAPSAAYTQPLTYNYSYNSANQRTKDTLADGSYWVYGYDSLGQVTNGVKYFSSGTPVAGQQFDYAFDNIGNRIQALAGGDQNGLNLRTNNYYANNLNQLTNRDVSGYVDVMGASILPLTNVVTVNGQTAYRNQEYFRAQIPANNSASALWTNIIVIGGQTVTGNVYVARESEHFSYDADGNLTNDGRWAYVWDGENRLIQMNVNTNVGPQYQLNFFYDYQGRRVQKAVSTNGVGIYTNNFLYDGWNLIAEAAPNNSLIRSYVWGSDLSGSPQGAGGVGGLLEVNYCGISTTNCFPAYDGNGNIMALVNIADGTQMAEYDYGPFGEPIRMTGTLAKVNPFRFSTKYDDDESDLLYYGYRYYEPSTGMWPNRDPIGEPGFELVANRPKSEEIARRDERIKKLLDLIREISPGAAETVKSQIAKLNFDSSSQENQNVANLYVFVENSPVSSIDSSGLFSWVVPFYFVCPSELRGNTCTVFKCVNRSITVHTILPRDPIGLQVCIAGSIAQMVTGCALDSYTYFSKGCQMAGVCIQTFW